MKQILKWLAVLGRLSNLYVDQQFKEMDINSSHHFFIMHICNKPGITQESLRTMVYVHPSNITRSLEHLEENGYITKEVHPTDKRTCRLYPTEKSKGIYEQILKVIDDWTAYITKEIPEDKVDEFAGFLQSAGVQATNYFFKH